jgi:hypothetical protein
LRETAPNALERLSKRQARPARRQSSQFAVPDALERVSKRLQARRPARRESSQAGLDRVTRQLAGDRDPDPREAPRESSQAGLDRVTRQLAGDRDPDTREAPRESSQAGLDRVTRQLVGDTREAPRESSQAGLDRVTRQLAVDRDAGARITRDTGPLDFVMPARPIALELIGGRGHYERVIAAVTAAHTSVWIATANVKELMVEDGRARPGRRRSMRRSTYVSILTLLDELAARGVELRLLHADLPSGPFREEIAHHPRLVAGGLALRRCPRVHMKAVIVDGELLYLGSANWTGAGLGAKGTGRRNFELGMVTDDAQLLDQIQSIFDRVWRGAECAACKLREECPGPLSEIQLESEQLEGDYSNGASNESARARTRKRSNRFGSAEVASAHVDEPQTRPPLPVRSRMRRRSRSRLL